LGKEYKEIGLMCQGWRLLEPGLGLDLSVFWVIHSLKLVKTESDQQGNSGCEE